MENSWTIGKLISWGTNYFADKGIDSPRLNIELMLAHILKCQRIDLYLHYDYALQSKELSVLRDFVKRRAIHEPLQYILGEAFFYGHRFKIDKRALIPRPETEQLVQTAISFLKNEDKICKILEVGTGSGCIAISIAKEFPNHRITAIDISDDAIKLAQENAKLHGLENIEFKVQDFLKYNTIEKYDLILSNPPYVIEADIPNLQKELKYEPLIALTAGEDSVLFYKKFVEFMNCLEENGKMILEINEKTENIVTNLFSGLYNVKMYQDYSNLERIIVIQKL